MPLSLPTLFAVGLGTLAVAAVMTFWERRFNAERARELMCWTVGYILMAIGCGIFLGRASLPLIVVQGVTNILMVGGYWLLLLGAMPFVGVRLPRKTLVFALMAATVWLLIGPNLSYAIWSAVGSFFITIPCFALALMLVLNGTTGPTRSWVLAAVVFGLHGMVYLARVVVIPFAYSLNQDGVLDAIALFTMFEGVVFSMAAPMALLSLTREESRHQLLRASQTDFLTGLDNRRAFTQRATPVIAERTEELEPAPLLVLFDLDNFKQINDDYGHDAGDQVLKIFGRVARSIFGPQDCVARMGGEEFAALLIGREHDEAKQLLRAVSARFAVEVLAETAITRHVTFSAGLVAVRPGDTLRALMTTADHLLYRAKQAGRNRVETDLDVAPAPASVVADDDEPHARPTLARVASRSA
ncbi:GGDEF domain-containing protein [Rhizobium sp. YIM 134829]|uniref:GGDEF domain-containing protein n=1 Tax=Rhizobium sp. YIM 134829 TaxID=3390453 RepID=UPI003979F831